MRYHYGGFPLKSDIKMRNNEVDKFADDVANYVTSKEEKEYKRKYAKRMDRIHSFIFIMAVTGWPIAIIIGLLLFSTLHGTIPNETGFVRDTGNMFNYFFGQWVCSSN